jgi:hypothetical protein
MDQAQELRDLLEAALDQSAMVPDRDNAAYMLIQRLEALSRELHGRGVVPDERP